MLRLFALATLTVNPVGYVAMREAAYARHELVHHAENKRREKKGKKKKKMKDTWHQDALDWVYPF
jgi:hypothetical protein